jgi:hypothetical protein
MLEWSVPDESEITPAVVKKANPASWITVDAIRSARDGLPELAYRRFVANQWVARMGSWLPAGAWQSCADPDLEIKTCRRDQRLQPRPRASTATGRRSWSRSSLETATTMSSTRSAPWLRSRRPPPS